MDRTIAHNPPPRRPTGERVRQDLSAAHARSTTNADDQGPPEMSHEQTREHLEQLAWLMDESIPVPILGIRVGVDGLLGLIPGVGDLITTGISTYIIRQAHLLGAPKILLLRMSFNTAIDFLIGAIPLVGDIFDLGWKANKRNVRLLIDHLDNPTRTRRASWWSIVGFIAGISFAIAVVVFAVIGLFAAIF